MVLQRVRAICCRRGTLVGAVGGTISLALAAFVSESGGLVFALATLGIAQIVHQDQIVRLFERAADEQGRQLATATIEAARCRDLAAYVRSGFEDLAARNETISSTMAKDLDELRLRMQQAYRHRERLTNQLHSVANLQSLVVGGAGLPPLRGWALMPDSAEAIFRLVRAAGAGHVVELGSGSSTALLAMEAEQRGAGRVTALEHDPVYVAQTNELLSRSGVTARALVLSCPLTPVTVDEWSIPWYNLDGIELPASIDVLIVDGPPGDTHEFARLPAELLFPRVVIGGSVVLDDADREARLVQRWLARPDFVAVVAPSTEKGLAILRRVEAE